MISSLYPGAGRMRCADPSRSTGRPLLPVHTLLLMALLAAMLTAAAGC